MQPHPYTAPETDRPDDYRARPAAEPRSWAPRTADATFTHNAARYSRPAEAPTPVEHLDLEPELSPPPRWMMMVAGAAVAALIGALLGGLMHI